MSIERLRRVIGIGMAVVVSIVCLSLAGGSHLRWKGAGERASGAGVGGELTEDLHEQALAKAARLLEDGRTEQAIVSYRESLSRRPGSVEAQLGIATGEALAGREKDAAREFERVLEMDPQHPEALLQLALIYSRAPASWARSETRYREYLGVRPGDAQAQLALARVLAWQRKPQEAAEIFGRAEVALLMTPADERDYAFALNKLGRPHDAEPILRKVLQRNPDDLEAVHQLAASHASRKQWGAALPLYRRVLEARPNDPQVNLTYGQGLLAARRYKEALGPLGKAASLIPSSGETGLAYARAWKGAGERKKASKEFERILPRFRGDPHVIREYADLMLERKKYKEAAERYREAERLGLRDGRLEVSLAGALVARRKHKEAAPYLEAAYRRAPTPRRAMDLAKVYSKTGRQAEARALLEIAESAAPQNARR